MTLFLSACGEVKKPNNNINDDYAIKDCSFIEGIWVTTQESEEQNASLNIKENKDKSCHLTYRYQGKTTEGDYGIWYIGMMGGGRFTFKNGQDIFNGDAIYIDEKCGKVEEPCTLHITAKWTSDKIPYDDFVKE